MSIIRNDDRQKRSRYKLNRSESRDRLIQELDQLMPRIVNDVIKDARDTYTEEGSVWTAYAYIPARFRPLYNDSSLGRIARRHIRTAMKQAEKRTVRVKLGYISEVTGGQICVDFFPGLH